MTAFRFQHLKGVLVAGAALLLLMLFKDPGYFRPADSFAAAQVSSGDDWFPLVTSSNAYLSWRADPWIRRFAELIAGADNPIRYQLTLLILLAAGLFLYLQAVRREPDSGASAGALLITAVTGYTLLGDTPALSTLALAPFLAVVLIAAARSGEFWFVVAAALAALRTVTTANHAAGAAFLLALFLARVPSDSDPRSGRGRMAFYSVLAVYTFAYLYLLYSVQQAAFPSYPATARVVPDDGLPGIIRPLIGPDTPIPVINLAAARGATLRCFEILALFSCFCTAASRRLPAARRAAIGAFAVSIAGLWDALLPEAIAQIGPLAALGRMTPDLFLLPLQSIAAGAAVILTGVSATLLIRKPQMISYLLLLTAFSATAIRLVPGAASPLKVADLAGVLAPDWGGSSNFIPGYEPLDWQNALRSPSRYVAQFFGRDALAMQYAGSFNSPAPLSRYLDQSWSSERPDLMPLLFDGRKETRYTTRQQQGGETIFFSFKQPVSIIGISLETGSYVTDFPRGIRVQGGEDCRDRAAAAPVLADFPSWQGPPVRTAVHLPYFGGQEDVRVPFQRPVTVTCVRITQTGKSDRFDWSVAEAGLLVTPPS